MGTSIFWFSLCVATFVTTVKTSTTTTPRIIQQNTTTLKYSTWESLTDFLIPTSPKIANSRCRIHSNFYKNELKKFTLWATEMFDSSAKFPNGILQGSTYEFGNYDECMKVSIPQGPTIADDLFFTGKYCFADVTLDLQQAWTNDISNASRITHPPEWNSSTWEGLMYAVVDRRQRPRNELHWAVCMPSSCTGKDLETHLQDVIDYYNKEWKIKLSVKVPESNCQIYEPYVMTIPQALYISVITIIVTIILVASIYEYVLLKTNPKGVTHSGKAQQSLRCFSLITNLRKLVEFKEDDDNIQGLAGIKVISMFCVIMGHRIMFVIGSPVANSNVIENFYQFDRMLFLNGPIIVDTFFCISGFLTCYLLLKEFHKRGNRVNLPSLYIHRILRMSAVYVAVVGFYCLLLSKIGSGPMWNERILVEEERCRDSWWLNLLYINNYLNTDKICMFQSWYIACDLHFFFITPPLIWLLYNKPKLGLTTIGGVTLLSIVLHFVVTFYGKFDPILVLFYKVLRDVTLDTTYKQLYIPSYTRATPYLIGIIAGYIRLKYEVRLHRLSMRIISVGWIMAVGVLEGMIYAAYIFYMPDSQFTSGISASYATFHHLAWSVGMSWFVIALSTGHGNFINPFLSWKPWITLSRITYGAFLFHGGLQLYSVASHRVPLDGNEFNLIWSTCGDILISYAGGLILSVLFESPILGLEKVWFRNSGKEKSSKSRETISTISTISSNTEDRIKY